MLLRFVLLISCFLLIRCDEHVLTVECRKAMLAQSYQADECMSKLESPKRYLEELNQTLQHYTENEVDFQHTETSISKLCSIIPKHIECALLIFNVSEDCHRPEAAMRKLLMQQMSSISNYLCENNGDLIKTLIPYNGLQFLYFNEGFANCLPSEMKDPTTVDELCSFFNTMYSCAVTIIGDHANTNIMAIVETIRTRLRQATHCSSNE